MAQILARQNWFGLAVCAFLALAMLLGGSSSGGYLGNWVLQALGAGLAGWAVASGPAVPVMRGASPAFGRFTLVLGLVLALQFVPLPPAVWQLLPGRGPVAAGYAMLGQPAPWLPLGLAPMVALADLGWMIPALAMYLAMRSPKAPPVGWLVWVVALVASASRLASSTATRSTSSTIARAAGTA